MTVDPSAEQPCRAREEIAKAAREHAAASRAAQGLPPTVEDPRAIADVVAIIRGGEQRKDVA